MAITADAVPRSQAEEEYEDHREHLMFDPKPRGEMNAMVMESMHTTNWKFWMGTNCFCKYQDMNQK